MSKLLRGLAAGYGAKKLGGKSALLYILRAWRESGSDLTALQGLARRLLFAGCALIGQGVHISR
jgi:hypothetical protein